jgi:hypothetical protein
MLLANHHVVFGGGAAAGDCVWALSEDCNVAPLGIALRGQIGRVTFAAETHFVDCALVALGEIASLPGWVRAALATLGRRQASSRARPGLAVAKLGPATGQTLGVIGRVDYFDHPYIGGRAWSAPRQLLIESSDPALRFCGRGDSGSALLDADNGVVGLLWGSTGSGQGIASPIEPVLDCLEVRLVAEVP